MDQFPEKEEKNLSANNKKIRTLVVLFVLAILIIGLIVSLKLASTSQEIRKKAATSGVSLGLNPSTINNTASGETFSVGVTIDTGDDTVSAAELHLTYDQTKLEAQSISAGSYLPVVLSTGQVGGGNASIILGSQPTEPKKGSGILATISFKTLTPSISNIDFASSTQVAAIGKTGNVLQSANDAQVIINPLPSATPLPTLTPIPTDTPIPTVTPIPTEIPTAAPIPTDMPTITPIPTNTPIQTATPTATPPSTSPICVQPPLCVNASPPCPLNTPPSGWCPVTPIPTIIPTATPIVEPTSPPASITTQPSPTSSCPRKGEGDANCDGKVDLLDFEIWRKELNGEATTKDSDFDSSGKVNLVDFEIWRKEFLK